MTASVPSRARRRARAHVPRFTGLAPQARSRRQQRGETEVYPSSFVAQQTAGGAGVYDSSRFRVHLRLRLRLARKERLRQQLGFHSGPPTAAHMPPVWRAMRAAQNVSTRRGRTSTMSSGTIKMSEL